MIRNIAAALVLMLPLVVNANYPTVTFSAIVKAPGASPSALAPQESAPPVEPNLAPPPDTIDEGTGQRFIAPGQPADPRLEPPAQAPIPEWNQPKWRILDASGKVQFDNLERAPCEKYVLFNRGSGLRCEQK